MLFGYAGLYVVTQTCVTVVSLAERKGHYADFEEILQVVDALSIQVVLWQGNIDTSMESNALL